MNIQDKFSRKNLKVHKTCFTSLFSVNKQKKNFEGIVDVYYFQIFS